MTADSKKTRKEGEAEASTGEGAPEYPADEGAAAAKPANEDRPDGTGEDGSGAAPEGAPEDAAPAQDPEAAIAELNDKLLRAVAELENFRRRAERERRDTAKYAIAGFARDVLTIADNLRRGIESVSAEDRAANPALETLAAGMELTERELLAALERHGISKMEPLEEPFDYDRHQAMFEVEDESHPPGTVVEVVQPGYMLADRLLRPAMVAVSKGGGGQPAAAAGDSGGAGDSQGPEAGDGGTGEDGGGARGEP